MVKKVVKKKVKKMYRMEFVIFKRLLIIQL